MKDLNIEKTICFKCAKKKGVKFFFLMVPEKIKACDYCGTKFMSRSKIKK